MPTTLETYLNNALTPVQEPGDARQDAMRFAPSISIGRGQAVAIKTADKLGYAYVQGASDGTQNIVGFSMYAFDTDASGKVYFGGSTTASISNTPQHTAPYWKSGIFDPTELETATTLVAQVDTFTPAATIEAGDLFTLTYTAPDLTVTAVTAAATSTTAASAAGPVIAAWNANPTLAAVATASGTATVILTSTTPGDAFTVVGTTTEADGSASDSQTFARAATTAPLGRNITHLLAGIPGSRLLANGFLLVP